MDRDAFRLFGYALCIVKNEDGKFLAVNETKDRGWWIPGGGVQTGETFAEAAQRECKEEAGIDIELKGLLRVEHSVKGAESKMRVIFYASPRDPFALPKASEDEHSLEARWVSLDEIEKLGKIRSPELVEWPKYICNGGHIAPLRTLGQISSVVPEVAMRVSNDDTASGSLSEEVGTFDEMLLRGALHGDPELVRKAILNGANLDTRGNGDKQWTALHFACSYAYKDVIRVLLVAGCSRNAKNNMGRTPLHISAETSADVLQLLLIGISLEELQTEDADGVTALDLTEDPECRELLIRAGSLLSSE